jgi:hypothetical protein
MVVAFATNLVQTSAPAARCQQNMTATAWQE